VPLALIDMLDIELANMSDALQNRTAEWHEYLEDEHPESDYWDLFFTTKSIANYMSRVNNIRLGKGDLLFKRPIDPEVLALLKTIN
jgi:hypothetical protein